MSFSSFASLRTYNCEECVNRSFVTHKKRCDNAKLYTFPTEDLTIEDGRLEVCCSNYINKDYIIFRYENNKDKQTL